MKNNCINVTIRTCSAGRVPFITTVTRAARAPVDTDGQAVEVTEQSTWDGTSLSYTVTYSATDLSGNAKSTSISLSQACEQCSLVSEGDSEGDVVKLVHLLMWRGRLSVKGTEETCRAIIAIPNTLKEDVLAGGAD